MATDHNNAGYYRLVQIIGQKEITKEQAAENRRKGEEEEATAKRDGRKGKRTGPRRARAAIQGLCPMSRSTLYLMMQNGTFPKPVKGICARATFWRVSDVLDFLSGAGKGERKTP